MYARLTTIQGNPSKIDDAIRIIDNDVVPAVKMLPGFKNGYWFADRTSGRLLALTLFETEKDLLGSDEKMSKVRTTATEKLGGEVKSVERFEVLAHV